MGGTVIGILLSGIERITGKTIKIIFLEGLEIWIYLAVPRTKIQPDNFPKLQSENELWDGDLYLKFYSDKQIPLI